MRLTYAPPVTLLLLLGLAACPDPKPLDETSTGTTDEPASSTTTGQPEPTTTQSDTTADIPGTTTTTTASTTDTGDTTTGEPLDCSTPGTVRIRSVTQGVDIHDTAATLEVFDMQPAGIRGTAGGVQYFLWRDGDIGDGALSVGTHDVGTYPFHMVLVTSPPEVDCETEPECRSLFGLAGVWDISGDQPFTGTLHATDLTSEDDCWDEGPPLDASDCFPQAGEIEACFNLPWP